MNDAMQPMERAMHPMAEKLASAEENKMIPDSL